jgi:peptidoglycan/LPS O-acetylase OafA/YrhL
LPSNVVTSVLRSYILNNFIFALLLALCISLPFTYLFNRLVLRPVQSIKKDMMDFANSIDPAIVSANSAPTNSVIDQAQETFNDV